MDEAWTTGDRRAVLTGLATAAAGVALPSCATAPTELNAEAAYALGREAYRYAFPLIYFARLRHRALSAEDGGVPLNGWRHSTQVVTPDAVGAPQTDTLYSRLWADLSTEPLLLRIPQMDGRYWSIQCCDFFGVTYGLSNRRNTTGETLIALVGPTWRGTLPPEVRIVHRAAMPWTFNVLRMYFGSETDRQTAVALQRGFTTIPLSAYRRGESWSAPVITPFAPQDRSRDPLADFKVLQHLWRECPPPRADLAATRRFAAIGLSQRPRVAIADMPAEIQSALARAEADGLAEILAITRNMPGENTANGWKQPRPELGLYRDRDYGYRAAIAQLGTIGTPISENVYLILQREESGAMLSGDARYELRYDANNMPEADAFWSLHAYRYTFTVIPNAINRYSISSRSPGLVYGGDGSLTLYLQADDPGGERSANWIPINLPDQPFFLITRAYEPRGKMLALQWPGPRLQRVG